MGSEINDTCCEVNHTEHEQFKDKTDFWDRFGIVLSSLCALHCIITPIFILALPVFGEFFENEWIHISMALVVVPVGLYAFLSGYRHHRDKKVVAMGLLGMTLIVISSLEHSHHPGEGLEIDYMTIVGGIVLVVAHYLNRRACLCHAHEAGIKRTVKI